MGWLISDFLQLVKGVGSEIRFVTKYAKQVCHRAWEPEVLVIKMVSSRVEKQIHCHLVSVKCEDNPGLSATLAMSESLSFACLVAYESSGIQNTTFFLVSFLFNDGL